MGCKRNYLDHFQIIVIKVTLPLFKAAGQRCSKSKSESGRKLISEAFFGGEWH